LASFAAVATPAVASPDPSAAARAGGRDHEPAAVTRGKPSVAGLGHQQDDRHGTPAPSRPGLRKITSMLGVGVGTVQRISRELAEGRSTIDAR
jgi:hypothetical protein